MRDASWPGIKAWLAQNPQRIQELLWSNPRVVFFREEPLTELDAAFGPRGAQGVPLTPGRSIAVDPDSIPYGTPVWLASSGPQANLQRLVMAQDTGSAIIGAVRADYFAGWGAEARRTGRPAQAAAAAVGVVAETRNGPMSQAAAAHRAHGAAAKAATVRRMSSRHHRSFTTLTWSFTKVWGCPSNPDSLRTTP